MDERTLFETFRIAIENEREAHAFYLKAAETALDPEVREFFRTLAVDELGHERELESRYVKMKTAASGEAQERTERHG